MSGLFSNISRNWNIIAHRPVECKDDANEFKSVKGRVICIWHALATPIKAYSGLGNIIKSIAEIALNIFSVITLNKHPKNLSNAFKLVVDVAIGAALLPVAMIANLIRGIVGTLHPAAMIKKNESPYHYPTEHPYLYGIFVNDKDVKVITKV